MQLEYYLKNWLKLNYFPHIEKLDIELCYDEVNSMKEYINAKVFMK